MRLFGLKLIITVLTLTALTLPVEKSFAGGECLQALKDYFSSGSSQEVRKKVLSLQAQITLNRLAWAHLKRNKDQSGIQSIESTIRYFLSEKKNSTDTEFIQARNDYEKAPLSRKALAEIAPYVGDILKADFKDASPDYLLNSSDAKFLSLIAQEEKGNTNLSSDHSKSSSILNFAHLINSSYVNQTPTKDFFDKNISSLETEIQKMSLQLEKTIDALPRPAACSDSALATVSTCTANNNQTWTQFLKTKGLQALLDTSAQAMSGNVNSYEGLKYGDLWLKVKTVKPTGTAQDQKTAVPQTQSPKKLVTNEYYKDPLYIIANDKKGRDPKNIAAAIKDKVFLEEWAKAITGKKKTFIVGDQLYDRDTGKSIDAQSLITDYTKNHPVLANMAARTQPAPRDKEERNLQANAMANGEQAYIYKGGLYNTLFGKIDPVQTIVDYKKKHGQTVDASSYKGMDPVYLSNRAQSMMNNEPTFFVDGKEYATDTGYGINSNKREIASANEEEDYKATEQDQKRNYYLSDLDIVAKYQKTHAQKMTCPYYAVVDKKKGTLDIYTNAGELQKSFEVLVGKSVSDKKTKFTKYPEKTTNTSTGAGEFTIKEAKSGQGYYDKIYNNNLFSLTDSKGDEQVMAIHQVPTTCPERLKYFNDGKLDDNRSTNGCVNLRPSDFPDFRKYMGSAPGCKVFILPEEVGNHFEIKNDEINFTTDKTIPAGEAQSYNFNNSSKYLPLHIKIEKDSPGDTIASREFASTLEKEKAQMMKAYKLDNDDYNTLAMLAYGIMGKESKFGSIKSKLWLKEIFQDEIWDYKCLKKLVSLDGCSDIANSRGYTQIKTIPKSVTDYDPTITPDNLIDPRVSAVTTMGFLAQTLQQIKSVEKENSKSGNGAKITRENLMDYMIYIYKGSRKKLDSDKTDPDHDYYIQSVKQNIGYLTVTETMNP